MADITSGLFTIVDGVSVISNATMQPVITAVDLLTSRTRRNTAGFTLDADTVLGVVPAQKSALIFKVYTDSPITIASATTSGTWIIDSTSGAVVVNLPLASTIVAGTRYTFKKKVAANTVTINRSGSPDVIGTTTSTAFILYGQEDYVTFECDPTNSIWYIVATNGPILSSLQTTPGFTTTLTGLWVAVANGMTLSLNQGIYDIEAFIAVTTAAASSSIYVALTNLTAPQLPISNPIGTLTTGSVALTYPVYTSIKNYVIGTASSTINLSYLCNTAACYIPFTTGQQVGKIVARRVG